MNLDRQAKPVNPPAGPCLMVIWASGDLSRWKLIPAIGNLAAASQLPSCSRHRRICLAESFRQQLNDEIKIFATSPIDPEFCKSLLARIFRLEICDRHRGWRRLCSPESSPEQTRQWSILGIGMLVV